VVNVQSGVVEVLSSHGDNHLGGDDFDQLIVDHIRDHLRQQPGIEIDEHSKAMARITRAAEQAKRLLSDEPYVQIEEEYLLDHQGAPIHLSLELARSTYEDMIADHINATMDATHIALKGARMTASDIDEIILVGGSTRTPCIRQRLFDEFGFEPHGEVDPDLCVAMGAAMQAAMINGQNIGTVLVDVTPYTYGTSAIGYLDGQPYPYQYVPIIHKNSVLPTRKSEAFMTHQDSQREVKVRIFQGEDPDALNNIEIGEFLIEDLLDVPAGNIITLTLDLDLNGILHVSAREKASGKEKAITINNAISRFETEALSTAKQRIGDLFGENDDAAAEESAAAIAARQLIKKAESWLDNVSAEDKEDMVDLIEAITDGLERGDDAGLREAVERLNDILYYLES